MHDKNTREQRDKTIALYFHLIFNFTYFFNKEVATMGYRLAHQRLVWDMLNMLMFVILFWISRSVHACMYNTAESCL